MPEIEAILVLLAAVAARATLANRVGIPYPILLVLGGLVLGFVQEFVPGLLRVELDPEVVFLLSFVSAMRRCTAQSATSTSKSHAWRSESATPHASDTYRSGCSSSW